MIIINKDKSAYIQYTVQVVLEAANMKDNTFLKYEYESIDSSSIKEEPYS